VQFAPHVGSSILSAESRIGSESGSRGAASQGSSVRPRMGWSANKTRSPDALRLTSIATRSVFLVCVFRTLLCTRGFASSPSIKKHCGVHPVHQFFFWLGGVVPGFWSDWSSNAGVTVWGPSPDFNSSPLSYYSLSAFFRLNIGPHYSMHSRR
jgi:hypothetical protein